MSKRTSRGKYCLAHVPTEDPTRAQAPKAMYVVDSLEIIVRLHFKRKQSVAINKYLDVSKWESSLKPAS